MALFGIGDTNRILVDVPVRYAPILGLPYDPDDDSVFEKSDKKINIKVPKGQGKAAAELHAARVDEIWNSFPGCKEPCRERL